MLPDPVALLSERSSMQYEPETRVIEGIRGEMRESNDKRKLCLQLRVTDKMQCGLKTEVKEEDSGDALAMDLIFNGHTTLYNCNGDNYSEDVTEDKLKDV